MYVGRKWLGYTDQQIWSLTPRQFYAQLKVHEDVTGKMFGGANPGGSGKPQQTSYIDQIPGW